MEMNPIRWFVGRKSNDIGSSALVRAGLTLGPFQQVLGGFIPREVNPWFYEALREALGILDGGLNRLVTMDGILAVEGGNDKLTQIIQNELLANMPVGDQQTGLQAFYAGMGSEQYEQGFSVGEMIYDRRGRQLIGLRVADSKGIIYNRDPDSGQLQTWYLPPVPKLYGRRDGSDAIETVLRNGHRPVNATILQGQGYTLLDPARIVYSACNPENDSPYGVSMMRGIEFVSQILVKMHNATGHTWDRFGDPIFHIAYKTKNRAIKDVALEARRKKLADDLAAAVNAKRLGNSADFTTAVAADDDVTVTIVGGDGQTLEIEMPAAQMMTQVLAKLGLPAWMMGVPGGTAERMSDNQGEVVLQESMTRFEARKPALTALVENCLRSRGYAWKQGDWNLVQHLPNITDQLKRAQAAFLTAQTQLMLSNAGATPPDPNNLDSAPSGTPAKQATLQLFEDPITRMALQGTLRSARHAHVHKAAGETWAIDDPALPKLQKQGTAALQSAWKQLATATLRALQLPVTKAAGAFVFDPVTMLQQLLKLQDDFILKNSGSDSEFVASVYNAWLRGLVNAKADDGLTDEEHIAQIVEQQHTLQAQALESHLHDSLKKTTVRVYEDDILQAIRQGLYDGTDPDEVAAQLRAKFDSHDYDWERLVGSEMVLAHAQGQLASMAQNGSTKYDWVDTPDACPICRKLAAEGPYVVGAGPLPVKDSHPGCYCVIASVG